MTSEPSDSEKRAKFMTYTIPLILMGIIAFSILASAALYIAQTRQYDQIVEDEADKLKDELSEKSFYVSQLSSQHLTSVVKVTNIMTKARSFQSGELDRIKLLLDAAKSDSSDIVDSFFILDKEGNLRYSTATDQATLNIIGTSLTNHPVYLETKETLKSFISPLTNAVSDNSLVFYVASPIIDQQTGEFKGTVAAKIRADTFAKNIEKLVVAKPDDIGTSSLSLIDPDGNIMYAGASTNNLGKNILSEEVLGAIPTSIKDGLVASLKEALSGTTGVYEINLKEHPELNTSNNDNSGASSTTSNPFDYILFSYTPVKVDSQIVMISFVTKSASLDTIVHENEIIGGAYMYVFIYGTLGTMTAFAIAIIIINMRLSSQVEAKTRQLQEINRDLNQKTKEISEQANKLRELDIEKEEFSAMITHELKTPLVPVIGYSELLLDGTLGELNEKQRETVQVMNSSAVSLSRLISDLLDVRKLELGKMKFEMRNAPAKDLIDHCIRLMQPLAQAKNVNLISRSETTSNDGLMVKCDPKRINQVLGNLVNNAIKFVAANTGKIELSITEKDMGEGILFSIKDNGVGIPKDKQQNIFRKFYQADTSMTRNAGGTGLGLAICKAIIEAHNGRIWFESEPGVGTTFYFLIPQSLQSPATIVPNKMKETLA